jgi:hypothetical protein
MADRHLIKCAAAVASGCKQRRLPAAREPGFYDMPLLGFRLRLLGGGPEGDAPITN